MHRLIVSTCIMAIGSVAFGTPAAAQKEELKFQSEEAVKAVENYEQLQEELDEGVASHWRKVRDKHLERLAKGKEALVASLEAARDKAAKQVDLDEANALQKAIDSFEAAELSFPIAFPEFATSDFPTGQWDGSWGVSGTRLSLDIDEQGVVNGGRWTLRKVNRRLLGIDTQNEVHLELIPGPHRLVLLGWSNPDEIFKDNMPQKEWLAKAPDRVATLRRVGVVMVPVTLEINRFPNGKPVSNVSHYGVDGDGRRGVLDLVFRSRELDWKDKPSSAELYFYVPARATATTGDLVQIIFAGKVIGAGRAPSGGQWYRVSLDTSLLQPSRMYVLQMRVTGRDAVAVNGRVSGKGPYLELVFEEE